MSEVSCKYEVLQCVINFDETHVTKSTKGDKGSPQPNILTNPRLLQAGTQVFRDPGVHVMGVFGSTPIQPMLPIVIYKTKSTKEKNMQIKLSWATQLPEVVG